MHKILVPLASLCILIGFSSVFALVLWLQLTPATWDLPGSSVLLLLTGAAVVLSWLGVAAYSFRGGLLQRIVPKPSRARILYYLIGLLFTHALSFWTFLLSLWYKNAALFFLGLALSGISLVLFSLAELTSRRVDR